MDPIGWYLSLTDHELQALGTFFGCLASLSTILAFLAARWSRLAFRNAEEAKHQTRRSEWVDGELHTVSVSEDANRAVNDTANLRAEIVGPRLHGRRRDTPTNPVPSRKESS